jgi:hypothetical protein
LAIDASSFQEEHLLPLGESQLTVAGLMGFKDASGKRSFAEISEPLRPRFS